MSAIPYPVSNAKTILLQFLRAILVGCLLFLIGLVISMTAFFSMYDGRIYPGVTVAGQDLSGLAPVEAAAQITRRVDYPERGRILLHDGGTSWTVTPAQLGFFVDPEASVMSAYQVGRSGSFPEKVSAIAGAWFTGTSLAPTLVFDQRVAQSYLTSLAKGIDRPVIEAHLGLEGAEVVVRSGQIGRKMNTAAVLPLLAAQLSSLRDGAIALPVQETPPIILDASDQAELARKMLSAPLTLTIANPQTGDPGPWTFEPQTLAAMLAIEKG